MELLVVVDLDVAVAVDDAVAVALALDVAVAVDVPLLLLLLLLLLLFYHCTKHIDLFQQGLNYPLCTFWTGFRSASQSTLELFDGKTTGKGANTGDTVRVHELVSVAHSTSMWYVYPYDMAISLAEVRVSIASVDVFIG